MSFKYTDNDIDFAYLLGVFNTGGIDVLADELSRLKGLGVNPHQIINQIKKDPKS